MTPKLLCASLSCGFNWIDFWLAANDSFFLPSFQSTAASIFHPNWCFGNSWVIDKDSFLEFGQFAVAAQRSRRDYEELQDKTNADGIITGFCSVNSELVGPENSQAVAIVYDYSVLAGTQGAFHHMKLDRICDQAKKFELPIIIFNRIGLTHL